MISGCDGYDSVVIDVHLDSGFFDDVLDHFAARTNHLADHVTWDLVGDETWSKTGKPVSRFLHRGIHDVQNMKPSIPGLIEGLLYDFTRQSADFDVHLQSGDPF